MTTIIPNLFGINGVIDTSKTVLTNLNAMCKAAGCWLSYDTTTGLWSVIINRAGSSIKSFTDSNIIGSISITGTGIDQLYNSVEVQFPHIDLLNTVDYANFNIAPASRLPNELDKKLTIQLDCINNPIQAAYVGAVELNQNRVDKIIQFKTDYTSLGLKAGDLIDVTNTIYGYTNKVFRITKISEEDMDDGSIQLSITALEYDANVYNTGSLVYTERTTATGVVPRSQNSALTTNDNNALVSQLAKLDIPSFANIVVDLSGASVLSLFNDWVAAGRPNDGSIHIDYPITFIPDYTGQPPQESLQWIVKAPYGNWTYTYNGTSHTVNSYFPMYVYVYNESGLLEVNVSGMDTGDINFHFGRAPFGLYTIRLTPALIYGSDGSTITPTNYTSVITNYKGGASKVIGYAFAKNVRQ
ncbi:hypothetical protein UFOVP645_33 [uncultured Caudovirales phage]|uniref:Tip attachment protein J n=1 Tax=uncultured Caudovirales phage TaxID=2100421 RepID=A0A6J5N8K2_9CAUD|nr:hypothetical protein UFOVP645_33 [uncultured Caudovirales phage]